MVNFLPKGVANLLASAAMLVCYSAIALITYWSIFDNGPPMVVSPPTVDGTNFVPGASVPVHFTTDNLRTCHIRATRVMIRVGDNATRILEFAERDIKQEDVGKTTNRVLTYIIPLDTVPGRYYLQSQGMFSCNPVQRLFPQAMNGPVAEIMVWGKK